MVESRTRLLDALRNSGNRVPQGSFFAFDDGLQAAERIAAMKRTHVLGAELAAEHPEVAELYRDVDGLLTYSDIASRYIPQLLVENPMFASRVVGVAVRSLIPAEEQEQLTRERRSRYLKRMMEAMGEEAYREHQRNANRGRSPERSTVEAMIRARGRIPWGNEERSMVVDLMVHDPEYQHEAGSIRGTPDYLKIADDINIIYHQGNPVRLARHVGSMVRDERRKSKRA